MANRAILITGASRGLGAELARLYADPKTHLILTAREVASLSEVEQICRKQGAQVTSLAVDLEDPDSVGTFHAGLADLELSTEGLSLVIANAGIFSGRAANDDFESVDAQILQINVNLTANIALLMPIVEQMKARRKGQIAVVSSLAADQPQPDSPAYSASKAGLSAWARAMADDLVDYGVIVSEIVPGHIQTAQTEIHQGALPGLVSAKIAASLIKAGLTRKKRRIVFPKHILWLIWLSNLLPDPLRRLALKPYRYTVRQEPLPFPPDGAPINAKEVNTKEQEA